MPGFDRTGPNGQGPRTGWGMGDCSTQETTAQPMRGGRGRGMGRRGFGGQGFGAGGGRGMGMRMRNRFFAQNNVPIANAPTEEIDELYNMVETLREQVAELSSRLEKTDPDKEQKS